MKLTKKNIKDDIIKFLKRGNPIIARLKKIPENESLLKLGYIDSFGLMELIEFIEKKFQVKINDNEITLESFGSLEKMSSLIKKKIK